jgi:glycosyltransferase involved in cell wall biosynthesis
MTAAHLQRKWRKLRRDPVRFFADAGNPVFRQGGLGCLVAGHLLGELPVSLLRVLDALRCCGRTHEYTLSPLNQLNREGDAWVSSGEDPQFHVTAGPGVLPRGWTLISIEFADLGEWLEPAIYVDDGRGYSEKTAIRLPATRAGRISRLVKLPRRVKALRLDPMARPGRLEVKRLSMQPLGSLAALRHALSESDNDLATALAFCTRTAQARGAEACIPREEYAEWIKVRDTLTDMGRDEIRVEIKGMQRPPLFSILMPVYNSNLSWLREAIDSVRSQLYPDWELCIVNDASTGSDIASLLDGLASQDSRIKVRHRQTNGGIVAASNDALEMASGDWIATLDHDDRLAEQALHQLASAISRHPEAAILYSDHDHLTADGVRDNPYFKPDWNYELALGQNYVNHLSAFRSRDVRGAGGFRAGFDGSQDWDLLLRLVETTDPENIVHIPHVLYHWRSAGGNFSQAQAQAGRAGRRAVEEHLLRTGQRADVIPDATIAGHLDVRWQLPETPPLVSVIIPTRDRLDLLRRCVDGVLYRTDYPQLEIIIVDNGSIEAETHAWFKSLENDKRIRILDEPGGFNFSRLCNRGVEAARGEVYVLLNNDIEVINANWLSVMVAHALRPGIGAVGAKLYYPNGSIQHGGVVLGIGGVAGHVHRFLSANGGGYQGRARLTQRMSAVTAACLAGRKEIFQRIGGFDEQNLEVAYNDVDFCLNLRESGYAMIWTPNAELIHHESASRGSDSKPEKTARYAGERMWMLGKWGDKLKIDPAYNSNLSLDPPGYNLDMNLSRANLRQEY